MRLTNEHVKEYCRNHPEEAGKFDGCPDEYVGVLSRNGRTGSIELLALAIEDSEVPESGIMPLPHWPQD